MPKGPPAPAIFVTSAATRGGFPSPELPEVAFIGRSNVGKSSLLNRLAGKPRLAHISKTPGRTRMVNFFQIGESHRLVDLPGYGFARAPETLRATWEGLVLAYLGARESLALNLLLVDPRRDPLPNDRRAFEMLRASGRPLAVVATKTDKMKRGQAAARLRLLEEAYGGGGEIPVIACSAAPANRVAGRPGEAAYQGIRRIRRLIAERVEAWR